MIINLARPWEPEKMCNELIEYNILYNYVIHFMCILFSLLKYKLNRAQTMKDIDNGNEDDKHADILGESDPKVSFNFNLASCAFQSNLVTSSLFNIINFRPSKTLTKCIRFILKQ